MKDAGWQLDINDDTTSCLLFICVELQVFGAIMRISKLDECGLLFMGLVMQNSSLETALVSGVKKRIVRQKRTITITYYGKLLKIKRALKLSFFMNLEMSFTSRKKIMLQYRFNPWN